jgi:hypothetical protein
MSRDPDYIAGILIVNFIVEMPDFFALRWHKYTRKRRLIFSIAAEMFEMPVSFHAQQSDLLGDQAEHENDHGSGKHERGHVGEPVLGEVGIRVVRHAGQKKQDADRQKHPER